MDPSWLVAIVLALGVLLEWLKYLYPRRAKRGRKHRSEN
jgi:hypothetical protein